MNVHYEEEAQSTPQLWQRGNAGDERPVASHLDIEETIVENSSLDLNVIDSEGESNSLRKQVAKALRSSGKKLANSLAKLPIPAVDHKVIIAALNQALSWQLKGQDAPVDNPSKFSFYAKGYMSVDAVEIPIPRVLFDTGATHASYVSENFVKEHQEVLKKFIFPHKATTVLGDGKTKCQITECLIVPCSFMDKDGTEYKGTVKFSIYKTEGYDFLIDLYFDRVSALFLVMGTFLTFLITYYSRFYLHREQGFKRFFNTILLFYLGYNIIILSGNFETLFIGWEFLGISSFLLILIGICHLYMFGVLG
jgi:hypothetical protein